MVKQLRPYQVECSDAFFDYFASGKTGNPLFVIPMRMGKSLQMADIMKRAHQMYPQVRFISVTTESKLLLQNEEELREYWPFFSTSFYSAKLKKRNMRGQVVFASIQSIWNKVDKIPNHIDAIFVDEPQDIGEGDNTMYRKFFAACKERWPAIKIAGFTGSPYRADSGYLHHGSKRLFTDIVYDIPISYAVEEGYWCPPTTPGTSITIDTSMVPITRSGDLHQKKLAEASDKEEITKEICADIVRHSKSLHPSLAWIVYATDTSHCDHIRDELRDVYGVACESLHSKIPQEEQDDILRRYEADEVKCIVVSGMLTKGFNKPNLALVALCRATASPNYYAQTAARGCTAMYAEGYDLTTTEGRKAAIAASIKPFTMILDYGDIINRLGPIDDIHVESKAESSGEGEAPTKICPKCYEELHAAIMECHSCGHIFEGQVKIKRSASTGAILKSQQVPEWHPVTGWKWFKHEKSGKPPSLRVEYSVGYLKYKEWVLFEHDNMKHMAWKWWGDNPPKSIDEAIERQSEKQMPSRILVKRDGKYDRVIEREYETDTHSRTSDSN